MTTLEEEIAWLDRREGGGSLGGYGLEGRSWLWVVDHNREYHAFDREAARSCEAISGKRSWARTAVLNGLAALEIERDLESGRISGSAIRQTDDALRGGDPPECECEWHGCENGCGDAGIPCHCLPHCVHCGRPMERELEDLYE